MNLMNVWREANEAWFRIFFQGMFPKDVAANMMEFIMDVHRMEKLMGGGK